MRLRFVCVCVAFCLSMLTSLAVAQQGEPSLSDLHVETQPPTNPKDAGDLAKLRAYYDNTVWADEVLAQEYERTIIELWDRLIEDVDRFEVIATVPFNQLVIGTVPRVQQLDGGVFVSHFNGPRKSINPSQWKSLVDGFRNAGFEINGTEWHHSEFHPPADGPARSVVSVVMFASRAGAMPRRLIVKGDLKITWSVEKSGSPPLCVADVVEATDLRIMQRDGSPPFDDAMEISFQVDDLGESHPATIRPLILHDLNGDQLPEVILAGYNQVYWNGGNWRFVRKQLCDHPSKFVSAAVLADFTGDGIADLLCAVRKGFPQLYTGTSEGKFPTRPRQIRNIGGPLHAPVALTAGDIDGDGDVDVFIGQAKEGYQTGGVPTPYFDATDSFPACLLVNDGAGNFHNAIDAAGLAKKSRRRVRAASLVDLDDDGDLDLLLTSDFCSNDLFLNDGHGKFSDASTSLQPRSYGNGMSHTFGDYNLDGKLDFLMFGTSSTSARRLDRLQLGRPGFPAHNRLRANMAYGNRMYLSSDRWRDSQSFVQAEFNDQVARTGWPSGGTTLDFDRDGDQDVFVVNGRTSGKTTRDYDARFWCHDIYFRTEDRPTAAIRNFFHKFQPLFGRHFSWHGYEHNALLMNLDGRGYTDAGFLMNCASVRDARATVSGDLDLDGRVDLIYEHVGKDRSETVLRFLRNRSKDDHHWVGAHLIPNSTCNSTQGAKVAIHLENGRVLLQHRISGHSTSVQHADTVHFGMGKSSTIQSIDVLWPNGARSELTAPASDKYHKISPDVK